MNKSPETESPPGVYFFDPMEKRAVETWANSRKLNLLHVDLAGLNNAASVLRKIGDDLAFPSWYGANFDALFDCLSDPENFPEAPCLLRIDGINVVRLAAPETFSTLIEVLDAAISALNDSGTAFWVAIDCPAHGVKRLFPA